ncbi:unnamed protein product [Ixodes pacificus]
MVTVSALSTTIPPFSAGGSKPSLRCASQSPRSLIGIVALLY